jgi:arginine:pyruvate transaminase
MRYAPFVNQIAVKSNEAWKLHGIAAREAKHNPKVILLTIGDPDMNTPQNVVNALYQSVEAGRTHYTSVNGELHLREAIADYYSNISPDNVVVVPGTQCGLFATAMCLLSKGDEVIVPEPFYVTYPGVIGATGATMVNVPLRSEQNFQLDVDDIKKAITPRSKAIIINSPNNPTGTIFSRETLEAITQLCQEHNLWLISDEVYKEIYYDSIPITALALTDIQDRTAVISSLSKSHAMTGWRLGWVIAPIDLCKHLNNLLSSMLFGAPMFIQDAAVTALKDQSITALMRDLYKKRRDLFCQRLSRLNNINVHTPAGGMFLLMDVRKTNLKAQDFANRLYEQEKVSVLAADSFGPNAVGHVRISLTVPDDKLEEAATRIERFVNSLEQEVVPRYKQP